MLDLEKSSFEHSTRKHVKSFSSGASSVQGAEGKQKKKKTGQIWPLSPWKPEMVGMVEASACRYLKRYWGRVSGLVL